MSKRSARPLPLHFVTVVNPYPRQPYQTDRDRKAFARWTTSIVGEHNLSAFYHKPKSPNMSVILVLKGGFSDFRCLLGEHRWREILKTPNKDQREEVSSIFLCTMTTPRSKLKKESWKQVRVDSSWFNEWSPWKDNDIIYPYPLPHFCRPPQENIPGNPLCRPLREDLEHESTDNTRPKPIHIPASRPAQRSTVVPSTYRSPSVPHPSDDGFDLEYDLSQTNEKLPTPPGIVPPGLGPLPSTLSATPFVPVIWYGADALNGDAVTVVPCRASDADTEENTLWLGYSGETDSPPPPDLGKLHGMMPWIRRWQCRKRKRNARSVRPRLETREAWHALRRQRQHHHQRARPVDWAWEGGSSSSAGSEAGSGSEASTCGSVLGGWDEDEEPS